MNKQEQNSVLPILAAQIAAGILSSDDPLSDNPFVDVRIAKRAIEIAKIILEETNDAQKKTQTRKD